MARRGVLKEVVGRRITALLTILDEAGWLEPAIDTIRTFADPPKSLEQLQRDVSSPAPGYDVHHIVEQTSASRDGFPSSRVNAPENLVRIPRLKHWMITGWYQIPNEDYGSMPPRQYLRGKDWEERVRVGHEALMEAGVLKPSKGLDLEAMAVDQLVERFIEICLDQDEALRDDDLAKFRRLFEQMRAVLDELKSRPDDQRTALIALYEHPNIQVRLEAAKNTLAVAPAEAQEVLEAIKASRSYPQAMEAGMCLRHLESGLFEPN